MMFYQIPNKTRIAAIITVEIAMVEAIDRFKTDPLETRSIAIIHHPEHEIMTDMQSRDSTGRVLRGSVNEHLRPQPQRVFVLAMTSSRIFGHVLLAEECLFEGEYGQVVDES
jgi:hypothetical protein